MEYSFQAFVLLPVGLGLLGFIEPCTIGAHLLFLETQNNRSQVQRLRAVLIFVAIRSLTAGLFGALIGLAGQRLIGAQTGIWLVFGLLYIVIGLAFLVGKSGLFKWRIDIAPEAWKRAQNPYVLGAAFGLNIPACAAPILFGLLGLTATSGTIAAGFSMMFLFGLFLSLPLVVFAVMPQLARWLKAMGRQLAQRRWIIGVLFLLLGLWSVWFGLYVDPVNWAGA
ncbi:MAG: sulfite exporter TauE/SafE family protein [Alphaproteobacteria bacterium]|nr:sulfite exporter TauE/SafE family protein [Alphaproteobacteria bacterium]